MVRGFSISTCERHGGARTEALAGSVQSGRGRVRTPTKDGASAAVSRSQGGAEVLGVRGRVPGNVRDCEQQAVRTSDEALDSEASPASRVRGAERRRNQDARDRELQGELARKEAQPETREQYSRVPRETASLRARDRAHRDRAEGEASQGSFA